MKLIKTVATNLDFINLVQELDAYLAVQDGEEHGFYDQYNHIDRLKYVIVAYENEVAVGCGAIKTFDEKSIELKRMFVAPNQRGKGVATRILTTLEDWAKELGFQKCILETGKRQPEAIALYHKSQYQIIENYGQYKGMGNSVCFEKKLI
jgi:GNAT superfamily N-acetyltransferase